MNPHILYEIISVHVGQTSCFGLPYGKHATVIIDYTQHVLNIFARTFKRQ